MLPLPDGYGIEDSTNHSSSLTVAEIGQRFKFRGTTDVVIAQDHHIRNKARRNHIEVELELKTTRNNDMGKHEPQAILEHLSSSYLNKDIGVLTVLTDLIKSWYSIGFTPRGKKF